MTRLIDEQREDRFVAAMCHASALTFLWGALVPLLTWLTQKDRSPYLRFQALQALLFQGVAIAAYFLFFFAWMAFFFLTVGAAVFGLSTSGTGNLDSGQAMMMMTAMTINACLFPLAFGLMLVYEVVALWAAARVLRGHPFRYPILGRLLEKTLHRVPAVPVAPAASET